MTAGIFHGDVLLLADVVGPLVFGDSVCFVVVLCRLVELLLDCDTFVVKDDICLLV
jgi:hypothetical protein